MEEKEINEMLAEQKKRLYQSRLWWVRVLAPLSIWLSRIGLKKNWNPNFMTLCMFASVLAACCCFLAAAFVEIAAVAIVLTVLGFLVILWFEVFDDADGIVARGLNKLSAYGTQLDFMMHLVSHPTVLVTFAVVIWKNLPSEPVFSFLSVSNGMLMTILCAAFIILEYVKRLCTSFDTITQLRLAAKGETAGEKKPLRFPLNVMYNLFSFPAFLMTFPLVLIVDAILPTIHLGFWVYLVFACLWVLDALRVVLARVIRYSFVKYRT